MTEPGTQQLLNHYGLNDTAIPQYITNTSTGLTPPLLQHHFLLDALPDLFSFTPLQTQDQCITCTSKHLVAGKEIDHNFQNVLWLAKQMICTKTECHGKLRWKCFNINSFRSIYYEIRPQIHWFESPRETLPKWKSTLKICSYIKAVGILAKMTKVNFFTTLEINQRPTINPRSIYLRKSAQSQ